MNHDDLLECCEECGEPTPDHEMVTMHTAPDWMDNRRVCVPCAERDYPMGAA